MSARERLFALAMERGMSCGTSRAGDGAWSAWMNPEAALYAPTEDAACAALLAKLDPPALPRLGKTPREEVRALLNAAEFISGKAEIIANATEAQREAWLSAFPDEPSRQMAPEAVALVEAMAEVEDRTGGTDVVLVLHARQPDTEDVAYTAWVEAGKPVWVSK